MKRINFLKWKFLTLLGIMVVFLTVNSCHNDDFYMEHNASVQEMSDFKLKKITFSNLKDNHPKALQKIKEINSLINMSSSYNYRTIYNDQYGVFIDTTQIVIVEKEGKHTITFEIVAEKDTYEKIENLILKSKEDGGYSAYIAEYIFTQEELLSISNGVTPDKAPSKIKELNTPIQGEMTISTNSSSSCIDLDVTTIDYCENSSGQVVSVGTNNADGICQGGYFSVTHTVFTINLDCIVGGGGSSGGSGGVGGGGSSGIGNGSYPIYGWLNPNNPGWTNPNNPGNNPSDGDSGNENNDNPAELTDANTLITTPVISSIKGFVKSLDSEQQTWWFSHPNENVLISQYLEQNNYSLQSRNFAIWAIKFFTNNPLTSWEQFENWFMTPREGQDALEYDANYWENPNLTFQQQDLPSWDDFNSSYPRSNGEDLVEYVGGAVQQAYNQYPSLSRGYCALKVSRALNYSGITIPQITTTNGNPGTLQGSDGKYYFLNAKALNKWMRETFGTNPETTTTPYNANHYHFTEQDGGTNGENFPNLVNGLKGIYSMVSTNPQWASGHADLIENETCVFGCHFNDTPPAPIDYIDIWVLE